MNVMVLFIVHLQCSMPRFFYIVFSELTFSFLVEIVDVPNSLGGLYANVVTSKSFKIRRLTVTAVITPVLQ